MIVLPIQTGILKPGDSLAGAIARQIKPGDIVMISSKAVSTVEGNFIDLSRVTVSEEALSLSKKTGRAPAFMQAVLEELKRLDGTIVHVVPGAALTEVKPEG